MIDANQRCAVAGCDKPRATRRDHGLGPFCDTHRYWQPVQHDPRTCPGCGSSFTPRRSDQMHCSKRCRTRLSWRRNYMPKGGTTSSKPKLPPRRRTLTCVMCGTDYLAVWGRYCSLACTNRAWKERNRDKYLEGKRHYQRRYREGAASQEAT